MLAPEKVRRASDVIVIGGGPSGSLTAYHLARAGVRTTLVDGQRFPRNKPCGGGLQSRAISKIPFDISGVLRGVMRRVTFSFGMADPCTRTYPEPLVYGVLRSEFDTYLLEQAERAGVRVLQGVRITGFDLARKDSVVVHTSEGSLSAAVLVGADGANSIVSRLINRREDYFWQTALYCEVPEALVDPRVLGDESMRIDWGSLTSGYAWAFSKKGYANIGAGCPTRIARSLKPYVHSFIESSGVLKPGAAASVCLRGHQLPTLTRHTRLAQGRVLLVGDAAGLVEPFTGDGMSFACHSAQIAADCIYNTLAGAGRELSAYNARLRSEIGRELALSRYVLAFSVAFPGFLQRLFRRNDAIWRTFCHILRGEESFQQLRKEILGPFQIAGKLIDVVTRHREQRALSDASNPWRLPAKWA